MAKVKVDETTAVTEFSFHKCTDMKGIALFTACNENPQDKSLNK